MQANKELDSFLSQVLPWCDFNDTGVVTSAPPGCNYDQNLGYCTSFAFLMVQNLYFSTVCCGRQDSCLQIELQNHSQVPPPRVPASSILLAFSNVSAFPHHPTPLLRHEHCTPTAPCSFALMSSQGTEICIFLFQTLLSIQMPKEIQQLCPSLQISPFRLMLDDAS